MTIHKIDREKLAEAVEYSQEATPRIDGEYWTTMRQAAENWLAITDPGFEVSEEMINNVIGFDLKGTMTDGVETQAYCAHVKKIMLESIFKAMIATMIKGE